MATELFDQFTGLVPIANQVDRMFMKLGRVRLLGWALRRLVQPATPAMRR